MKILVCPLDWGLGHATRCVPLIRALLANGHEVAIGASGGGLRLLRGEFPGLECFDLPGYRVRYARSAAAFLPVMLAQLPAVLLGFRAERKLLQEQLALHPRDLVISDGRYGLKVDGTPCIFITHQVGIRIPGGFPGRALAERILRGLNLAKLRRFDRVWIPDHSGDLSLSGDLGRAVPPPIGFEWIGPLSRFEPEGKALPTGVDILAVVSGPEPQRGLFEAALRRELATMPGTRVLVRGLPGEGDSAGAPCKNPTGLDSIRTGELTEFTHLPGADLARLFRNAGLVVARSGYTTVMELAGLGAAAAVLVPTPGQSEQEYLADYLQSLGAAVKRGQDDLGLGAARFVAAALPGFRRWRKEADGDSALRLFLSRHPLLARVDTGVRIAQL